MRYNDFLEHLLWLLSTSDISILCDEYDLIERTKKRENIEILLKSPSIESLQDCLSPLPRSSLIRLCDALDRSIDPSLPKQELLVFMTRSLSKFKAETWEQYAPIPQPNQSFTSETNTNTHSWDLQELGPQKSSSARNDNQTKQVLCEITQLSLKEVEERLRKAHGNTRIDNLFEDVWPELETEIGIQKAIEEDRRSAGQLDVITEPKLLEQGTQNEELFPQKTGEDSLQLRELLHQFHLYMDDIESIHAYKYMEGRPIVTRYLSRGAETFGVVDATNSTIPVTPQHLENAIERLKNYRKRDIRYIAYLAQTFSPESLAWLQERKVLAKHVALYEVKPHGFMIRHNERKRILLWGLLEHFLRARLQPLELPKTTLVPEPPLPPPQPSPEEVQANPTSPSTHQIAQSHPTAESNDSIPTPPASADQFLTGGEFVPKPSSLSPSMNSLEQGGTLGAGRYRIEQLLGQGGMGRVFKVHDNFTKHDCALKLIHPHLNQDPKIKERFLQEVGLLHTLQHPNIIRSYDIKEDPEFKYLFYTMELLDGCSLAEKINKQKSICPPLSFQESFSIMEALSDALAYLHSRKIVHRDIKPGNIFLAHDGVVKLMDFGIAVTFSQTHQEAYTSAAGTPHFLAPEQFVEGEEISPAADIFALGVLSFYLLSGKYPPRQKKPQISPYHPFSTEKIDDVIQKATHEDPRSRYHSVHEFWKEAAANWPTPPKDQPLSFAEEQILEPQQMLPPPQAMQDFPFSSKDEEPSTALQTPLPPFEPLHRSPITKTKLVPRLAFWLGGIALLLGTSFGVFRYVSCPKGQKRCDGKCVSLAKDKQHCGKCGQTCSVKKGLHCQDGSCRCSKDKNLCGGTCVALLKQTNHCGTCGNSCAVGASCENGRCVCPAGQTLCGRTCVELQSNSAHCGTCGHICKLGCHNGRCKKKQRIHIKDLPQAEALRIKAGNFFMGLSKKQERSASYYEYPVLHVQLRHAFWMWKTEVTQSQFKKVLGYNPSKFTSCGEHCPVEQVTWHEAAYFCNRLSAKENRERCYDCKVKRGRVSSCAWKKDFLTISKKSSPQKNQRTYISCGGWRLPTEAEWEYAARGKTPHTPRLPAPETLQTQAWLKENSQQQPHPTAQKSPNSFGLFDMLGNVREWTAEARKRYKKGSAQHPYFPPKGSSRVVRGGSWRNSARTVRSTQRTSVWVKYRQYGDTGFRPVRTIETGQEDTSSLKTKN